MIIRMKGDNRISKGDQILEQIIRWTIFGTIVGVPLFNLNIVWLGTFYSFTFPKAILFQALVEIMAGALVILAIRNPRFRPQWRHPVVLGVLAFFLLTAISQFFSTNFSASFWSTQNRMTGLFHYAHVVAWFFVIYSVIKTRTEWKRLLTLACVAAAGVAGIGIVEWFARGFQQLDSTLGNSIYLGTFLLLSTFLALLRYQYANSQNERRLFLGFFFLLAVVLFLAESRSAVLGLAAGLALWGILEFVGKKQAHPTWQLRKIIIFVGVILLALFIFFATSIRAGRLGNLFDTTIGDRIQLWQIGWQAFQERPVTGWGFDQFSVPFSRLRNINTHPALTDYWDDRAHNIFIDTMVVSGIVGLLGYFLLWASVVFILIKHRRTLPPSVVAFFAAFHANGFFQPEQLTSNIVLFFMLAWLARFTKADEAQDKGSYVLVSDSTPIAIIAPPIVIIFFLILFFGTLKPLATEMRFFQALRTVKTDITEGHERFEALFSAEYPYQFDMLRNMAGVIIGLPPAQSDRQKSEIHKLLLFTQDHLDISLERNPDDLKTVMAAAFIQRSLVQYDPEAITRLEEYANRVKTLAPYLPESYELLGFYAVFRKDYDTAIDWYEQGERYAYAAPRKISIASSKAQIFASRGRWDEAVEEFHKLSDLKASIDADFLVNISRGIEVNSHVPEEFLLLTEKFVKSAPKSISVLKAAAVIFHTSGNHEKRDVAFKQLQGLAPEDAKKLRERLSF